MFKSKKNICFYIVFTCGNNVYKKFETNVFVENSALDFFSILCSRKTLYCGKVLNVNDFRSGFYFFYVVLEKDFVWKSVFFKYCEFFLYNCFKIYYN